MPKGCIINVGMTFKLHAKSNFRFLVAIDHSEYCFPGFCEGMTSPSIRLSQFAVYRRSDGDLCGRARSGSSLGTNFRLHSGCQEIFLFHVAHTIFGVGFDSHAQGSTSSDLWFF